METILGRLVHSLTNQRTQLLHLAVFSSSVSALTRALATMVVQIWMPGLHLKLRWPRKVSISGPAFGVIASHQEVAEMDGSLCRREAVGQRGWRGAQQRAELENVLQMQAV